MVARDPCVSIQSSTAPLAPGRAHPTAWMTTLRTWLVLSCVVEIDYRGFDDVRGDGETRARGDAEK